VNSYDIFVRLRTWASFSKALKYLFIVMIVNPTFKQIAQLPRRCSSRTPELRPKAIKTVKQQSLAEKRSKSRLDSQETERHTTAKFNTNVGLKALITERRGASLVDSVDKLLEATLQAQTLQAQLARQTPVPRRSPKQKPKQLLFTRKVKVHVPKFSTCKSLAAARYEAKTKRVTSQESLYSLEGLEQSHRSFRIQ
jgi:hypothetical protein